MHGVEFVQSLVVNTTANSNPSAPGDIIAVFPISPTFFPGTGLYKSSQEWEKYRWRNVNFHYLPTCPSTTNGALLFVPETDPERVTFSIVTDQNTRVREALSREGAKVTHPFNDIKIRVPIPKSDTTLWYDVVVDEESELSIPGLFYVLVESKLTDPNSQTTMTTGQLMIDYEIEYCSKSLIDVPIPVALQNAIAVSGTNTNLFKNVLGNGQVVQIDLAQWGFNSSLNVNQILIITFNQRLFDVTAGTVLNVNYRQSPNAVALGFQGSVVYGFTVSNVANAAVFLTPCIEDAIIKSTNNLWTWNTAVTGGDTTTTNVSAATVDLTSTL